MKKNDGILIMPATKNESSIKNVVFLMFDKECLERERLPIVNKVLFIEPDSIGEEQEPNYTKILSQLGLDRIEIRRIKIENPVKDIPPLIKSAVREVGPDNIILDLTCGLKDLTGSLYTAATLSGIECMTYTTVATRNSDEGRQFYDLSKDGQRNEHYSIKKFESIDELEELAAMNNIEFIAYKQMVRHLKSRFPNYGTLEFYCSSLDSSIDNYFKTDMDSYMSSVQKIGVLNEHLVGQIAKVFVDKYSETCQGIGANKPFMVISKCQEKYEKLSRKSTLSEQEQKDLSDLGQIFDVIPILSQLVSSIRLYRNAVSHELRANIKKDDAKLCIDFCLKILNAICESPLAIPILGIADKEFEE